jgi:RNA polymerase sigma-70 factor (ECF subfamily)
LHIAPKDEVGSKKGMETITKSKGNRVAEIHNAHTFEDLYRQYFVRLYRWCFSIVHLKEPAEEIVNDVFLKLWKKKDTLSSIDNLDVYLYVSVKNLSLNYLRNDHHSQTVDLEGRCEQHIQFNADPETLLLSSEGVQKVRAAIDELPPRCKLIFSLIKEDGLKYKEVAVLLNLSVKTVEAQLVIAVRKIAASIGLNRTHDRDLF